MIDSASVEAVRESLRDERWYETNPLRIQANGVPFDGIVHRYDGAAILELDPAEADLPRLKELGYEVFTSIESLRGYVRRRNQEAAGPVAN